MMSDLIEGVGEEIIWAGLIALSIAIITMAWISTGMPPIEYYVWLVQMQIYPNRRVVQVLHMDHEDAGVLENQLVQRTATMQHNITANVMTTTSQAVTNSTNTNSGNITEQSQNQLSNAVSSNNDQRSEPSAWSVEQSSTTLPTTHHWEVELGSASSSSSNSDTTENASNRLQQTLRRRALAEQSTGGVDSNVHSESSQSRRLLLSRVRVPLQEEHSAISTPQHESEYDSSAHANDIDSLSSEILASSTSRIEVVERVQDRTTTTTTTEAAQEELGQTNDGGSETEARQPQKTSAANTGDIRMNGASNETSTSALIANSSTNLVQDNTRSTNSENVPETILSVSEGLPNSNDNNEKESEKRTARIADENANDKLNSINNDKEKGADESSSSIIRLKFLDDSQMFANTTLDATVGQFKRRYFLEPLGAGKVVRLIYRGQLLRDDTRSLQSYGLHDQCVLHCNISSTPYAQANNNSNNNNNNNSSNQMNLGMIPRNAFQESSLQSATAAAIAAIAGTQSVNVGVVAERRTSQNQVPAGQTYRGESIEDNPSQSVALRARNAALRSYRWIHNVVFGLGASDSLNSVGNNGNVNDAVEQAAEAAARGWTAGQREDQPIIGGRLGQSLQFLFIVKFMMLWAFVFFYPQYTDRFSMLLLTLLTLFFATIVFSNRYNRYNS